MNADEAEAFVDATRDDAYEHANKLLDGTLGCVAMAALEVHAQRDCQHALTEPELWLPMVDYLTRVDVNLLIGMGAAAIVRLHYADLKKGARPDG